MSLDAIARHVLPGDVVVAGQVMGEPTALLEEVLPALAPLEGIRLFVGMSLTDIAARVPPNVALLSSVGMAPNSELIAAGRMQLVPCHMSQLPWLLGEGPLRTDVALVLVSPPDPDGYCSLGVTSDYAWHAVQSARVVLAEINDQVPVVRGDTSIHVDRLAYTVRTHRPLPEYARAAPTDVDMAIASRVSDYVQDRSCIQVGIGRLGEAVLRAVADRRDLGVHTGMVGDTILEMMRDSVITNAAKHDDSGLAVAGSILGSARALALAAGEAKLRIVSISRTHEPARMAALGNFVSVNSALEVDIFGQVNSEMAGGRYIGALGGAVDFMRGAISSPGGRSVVALPARTTRGPSRIVPLVERVTATAADVDIIATEYGVAELRGCSADERVRRIVGLAAPEDRRALCEAASAVAV